MKLSKKDGLKLFAFMVAMIVLIVITGFDLIFSLPLMTIYLILYFFDKSTPQHQSKTKIISYLALLFLVIFGKSLVEPIFKDNIHQVCGILIKNDFEFFDRLIFNPPNTLIEKDTQTLEFRSFSTNILINSQVCVNYIESDNTIWLFNDYVLDIKQSEN